MEDLSYPELLSLEPQLHVEPRPSEPGRPPWPLSHSRPATGDVASSDVKEPGLDDELARILEETDMWDHVVAANTETLPKLLAHPKLKLLGYKGALYEGRQDIDPAAVEAMLAAGSDAHPGRPASNRPSTYDGHSPAGATATRGLRHLSPEAPPIFRGGTNFVPAEYLRQLQKQKRVGPESFAPLLDLLRPDEPDARRQPSPDPEVEPRARNELWNGRGPQTPGSTGAPNAAGHRTPRVPSPTSDPSP